MRLHTIRPLLGIPMRWVTEITHFVPLRLFLDRSFGPASSPMAEGR